MSKQTPLELAQFILKLAGTEERVEVELAREVARLSALPEGVANDAKDSARYRALRQDHDHRDGAPYIGRYQSYGSGDVSGVGTFTRVTMAHADAYVDDLVKLLEPQEHSK